MNICGDSSSEEQDLFQSQDDGSIPISPLQKEITFCKIVHPSFANKIFKEKHYAHREVPISVAYGAWISKVNKNGRITGRTCVGAISFGKPASPSLCVGACGKENSKRIFELNRLWMDDICPKNTESRFIGWSLKRLREEYKDWIIVSYADTAQGHTGTIYRATGWTYTGLSDERKCGDYATEGNKHSRHSEKNDLPNVPRSRKHRYFYFLNKEDIKLLKYPILKYSVVAESE